jgi:hydroxymethylglutaryl-CoA lyase
MSISVKINECPRDAMQGIKQFIPTDKKVAYINALLKVGFDTLDMGSFVSPKWVPQMADTVDVLKQINTEGSKSKLSVIVANMRGAHDAVKYHSITYLGFPFSISETFQHRNTNAGLDKAYETASEMISLCNAHNKQFIAYLSMAFGNPYGDEWSVEVAEKWIKKLQKIGANYIMLSDTIGVADATTIEYFFKNITRIFPGIDFGAHFHTTPTTWKQKIEPAYINGCKRFDGAIKGFGGCPMAKDDLTGNMPTENMVDYFTNKGIDTGLDLDAFAAAMELSKEIFPQDLFADHYRPAK